MAFRPYAHNPYEYSLASSKESRASSLLPSAVVRPRRRSACGLSSIAQIHPSLYIASIHVCKQRPGCVCVGATSESRKPNLKIPHSDKSQAPQTHQNQSLKTCHSRRTRFLTHTHTGTWPRQDLHWTQCPRYDKHIKNIQRHITTSYILRTCQEQL